MPDRLRLILFDVDGTLLDSYAHISAAMEHAFSEIGLPKPAPQDVRNGIGLSVEEMIASLAPTLPQSVVVRVALAYRKEFRAIAMKAENGEVSPLFEGAMDVIQALAAEDFTLLGVASGKSRAGFDRMAGAHGLEGIFHTLQLADGHPSKPHPSMVQTAMAEMGVSPGQTVVVGDTSYDMLMARAAKARAIGVDWGYHRSEVLSEAGAEAVATSFVDLYSLLSALR